MRWSGSCGRREAGGRSKAYSPCACRRFSSRRSGPRSPLRRWPTARASTLSSSAGRLRVGTTGDYRPFTALDKATGRLFRLRHRHGASAGQGARGFGRVCRQRPGAAWPRGSRKAASTSPWAASRSRSTGRRSVSSRRPTMRDGKTPIARCADQEKFQTLADIDRPGVKVIANPGGTNDVSTARACTRPTSSSIRTISTIFDQLASGDADVMITDASETRFQAEAASRRALRHPSRQAVRFRREGLLDAPRPGLEGLRRPVAASHAGERRIRRALRQVVPLTETGSGNGFGRPDEPPDLLSRFNDRLASHFLKSRHSALQPARPDRGMNLAPVRGEHARDDGAGATSTRDPPHITR